MGVSRAQLFNYLNGKHEPSLSFFKRVKETFPWVNIEWLITGERGEAVGEPPSPYPQKTPVVERIDWMLKEMGEEAQRDVLKYTEEKKLLAELMAERQGKKAG